MSIKFPIGEYVPKEYEEKLKDEWVKDIREMPDHLESAIINLNEERLQIPYRKGGWTVHQLIHHFADSHMLAYIRFKVGYAGKWPTVQPYDEKDWVNFSDVNIVPAGISISFLKALHMRWSVFLADFTEKDFRKSIYHPEYAKHINLWSLLGLYAWHCKHHVAHINVLRKKMKW